MLDVMQKKIDILSCHPETDLVNTFIRDVEPFLDSSLNFIWLGNQSFNKAWELQKFVHKKRVKNEINDCVFFVEHPHVYTLGKNADENHLLDTHPAEAQVIRTDRGGDITYHGPGQLVCYPILDLHDYRLSVSWYMRSLEEVIIQSLAQLGVESNRKRDLRGVWIDDDKIAALGVRLSRWVTKHGFALNVNPDMRYFDSMIPCGLFEYGVTSIHEQKPDCIQLEKLPEIMSNLFLKIFKGIK